MEPLEFIADICIIPVVQLFSAIIVAFLRYLLEKGGQAAPQTPVSNPTGPQTPISSTSIIAQHAPPVIPWPVRVFLRGTMIFTYVLTWFFTTLIVLDALRSFTYFVEKMLYETQNSAMIGDFFSEFFQIVSIDTIADFSAFAVAAIAGLLAVAIVEGMIKTFFWILDLQP